MTTPSHKNHSLGGHEIYNLGRPFLGHHCYALSQCEPFLGGEKKFFKKYINFSLPLEWRFMKFTISCLLNQKMLYTNFGQDWPGSL